MYKRIKKSRKIAAVWFFALIFAIVPVFLLSGCSNYHIPEEELEPDVSSVPEISFENADTLVYGSIFHGPYEPRLGPEGRLAMEYEGGEFVMDYEVTAEGTGKDVGFFLFLNGSPQPYHLEEGGEEKYLHSFTLETDNEPCQFRFCFTPIQGKQGETLTLTVLSVYNPGFQPDMEETSSYGWYHQILPCAVQIHFNEDAQAAASGAAPVCQGIMTAESGQQKLTREFLSEELPANGYNSEVTPQQAEQQLYQSMLYNDKIIFDNLAVGEGEKVRISYKLCGPPGSEYETTFFLNHQPVLVDGALSVHTVLTKGDMQVIEAELDMTHSDGGTFYAITVPVHASGDFDVETVKTSSILFYKERD